MRYWIFFIIFILNCGKKQDIKNQEPQFSDTVSQQSTFLNGEVSLNINISELPNKCVQINGTTNLPQNTILILSIDESMQGGFSGESECTVTNDGSFISEAFGPSDGLKDGLYIAEVTMPYPQIQQDNVKKIIGEKGENLYGQLVERDSIGATVSNKIEFSIGGNHAMEAQLLRKQETQKSINKLKLDLCIYLEKLLNFKDMQDFKTIGFKREGPYYKWLKDVESLRDAQPVGAKHPIPIELRAAPGELLLLGLEYMQKQNETDFIRKKLPELQQTIDYSTYVTKRN